MKIVKKPANAKNVIAHEEIKNMISFNDGELALNLEKRERDGEIHIDVCADRAGSLVIGCAEGLNYVAEIIIPAREYKEVEEKEGKEKVTKRVPVPFNMEKCTLILWEVEE